MKIGDQIEVNVGEVFSITDDDRNYTVANDSVSCGPQQLIAGKLYGTVTDMLDDQVIVTLDVNRGVDDGFYFHSKVTDPLSKRNKDSIVINDPRIFLRLIS